ncbi:MAG: hypothetical protein QOJ27_2492 [Sphingomonadales bacterium]|nr:hypothetical protein [Sphingomonadales bacterium]
MAEVSLLRLYVMRAFYLLILLGVGSMALPSLIAADVPLRPLEGVAFSFWGALALLAGVGLRYPLRMVPLLVVQLVYKALWLLAVALPLWRAGAPFDDETARFTRAMAIGVGLDLIVVPWRYVFAYYARTPGDRWAARHAPAASAAADKL